MKVRSGFVSNSSSSSFIAITIQDEDLIKEITTAIGISDPITWETVGSRDWYELNYGIYRYKNFPIALRIGYDYFSWVGMLIEDELKNNLTVLECKKILQQNLKNIGIDISIDSLTFRYGTCSSE